MGTTESITVAPGFYCAAAADGDRLAVIGPGEARLSFGELGVRANRVANALRSLGLVAGDVVAAVVRNDRYYFELVLATGQIGLYLVPVNTHLAPPEVRFIVEDSGAKVVVAHADEARALDLVSDELPDRCFAIGARVPGWRHYGELDGSPDAPPNRQAGAVMGYTSGTTGRPKGVKRRLAAASPEEVLAAIPFVFGQGFGMHGAQGVHLVTSPLYHSAPGAFAMAALHMGHSVVVHSKFEAEPTLRDIERHQVTSSHMVPTQFHRLLSLPDETRQRYDLSSLQSLVHAGAPCPIDAKQRMIDWVGPIVWEYLGATEGMVAIVSSQEWLRKPGTVGRPAFGSTVKILDDDGLEVPTGVAGTIYVGSAGADFEYHNDPTKTEGNRVGGLYTVGDIGRLDDDGYLYLLDRRSDLILSGGVNIYPAEVEQQLISHPAISDVAVVGVPDQEWGQSVLAIVQLTDPSAGGDELAAELLAHCEGRLAAYKRPRRFEFRTELPRTATGKLLRRNLRDEYVADNEG